VSSQYSVKGARMSKLGVATMACAAGAAIAVICAAPATAATPLPAGIQIPGLGNGILAGIVAPTGSVDAQSSPTGTGSNQNGSSVGLDTHIGTPNAAALGIGN